MIFLRWNLFLLVSLLLVASLLRTGIAQAESLRHFKTIQAQGGPNVALTLHRSRDGSVIEFRARNNDPAVYSISVAMELENMESTAPLPFQGTLEAQTEEVPLFRIARVDREAPFFYKRLSWRLDAGPSPQEKPVVHNGVYQYPWPRGMTFTVDNGFNGYGAHQGLWAYAVDFKMPVGTPVCAARDGKVIALQTKFSQGGDDPGLGDKANYIFIRHRDGSIGRYLHIRKNGALVKVGQLVQAGDQIAFSGNVGWSTDPHLHFDVVVPDPENGQKTIPFEFRKPGGGTFEPEIGMQLHH